MERLLYGLTNVHPSNTDYILTRSEDLLDPTPRDK